MPRTGKRSKTCSTVIRFTDNQPIFCPNPKWETSRMRYSKCKGCQNRDWTINNRKARPTEISPTRQCTGECQKILPITCFDRHGGRGDRAHSTVCRACAEKKKRSQDAQRMRDRRAQIKRRELIKQDLLEFYREEMEKS